MITPDAPASIHHLFPLMAPLAFGSLNDIALVASSITGSTLAAKRSTFVLVEDDVVTLRLPELWGAPWLRRANWRAKARNWRTLAKIGLSGRLYARRSLMLVDVVGDITASDQSETVMCHELAEALAAKRSAFVLVEDDAMTLRLPEPCCR